MVRTGKCDATSFMGVYRQGRKGDLNELVNVEMLVVILFTIAIIHLFGSFGSSNSPIDCVSSSQLICFLMLPIEAIIR